MVERVDSVLLRYSLDEQALNRSRQKLDSARQGMKAFATDLKREFNGLADTGRSVFGSLGKDANAGLGLLRKGLVSTKDDLQDLREEVVKAEKGLSELYKVRQSQRASLLDIDPLTADISGGSRGRGVQLQRAAGALRGVGLGAPAEFAAAGDDLQDLGEVVKSLGAKGVITAGAIGAIALAIDAFSKEIDRGKAALEGAITGVHAFYQEVGKGLTTDQAQAKLKQLRNEQLALAQEQGLLSEQAVKALRQENEALGGLGTAALTLLNKLPSQQLEAASSDISKAYQANIAEQQKLTRAMTDGTLAANDAAAAEQKRLAAVRESLSIQVDYYRQYDAALKLSADAIREKQKETLREYQLTQLERDTLQNSNDKSEEAQAKIAQLNSKLEALAAQSEALTNALPNAQNVDNARKAAENQRLLNLENDLNSDQIRDRIVGIQEERKALIAGIQSLKDSGDTSQAATAALADYNKQLLQLENQENILTSQLAPLIKAREDEAAAVAEQKQALEDTAKAVQKYNDDVTQINSRFHEQQAALAQKSIDDQLRIIQQAADASQKALENLQQAREKLALDAARAEQDAVRELEIQQADAQIQAQRDEAKALADHLRTLQKIRDDAQDAEFEQGLDRDFAGLARTRRQTARQIAEENQNFVTQQQERQQQLQQTLADNRRNFEQERAARLIQLQQRLQDANASYVVEQKQIEAQRQQALIRSAQTAQRDLQLLQQKHTSELALRRQAIEAELRMVNLGAQARLRLEADIQAALIAQSRSILAAVGVGAATGNPGGTLGGGGFGTRALGGGMRAGETVFVNDGFRGQRESFNGRAFPPGLGIFTALQPGRVDAGKGAGANVTINMSIQGGNNASPEAIAAMVEQRITHTLERISA